MSYFQDMLARMVGAQKREIEKRDAETEAYDKAMEENAEYLRRLEAIHGPRAFQDGEEV